MLDFLQGKASDRKLRLFACACCRRIWPLLKDERSRSAVEVGERYADGLANEAELVLWRAAALDVSIETMTMDGHDTAEGMAASAARYVVEADEIFIISPEPSDWNAASEAAGFVIGSLMARNAASEAAGFAIGSIMATVRPVPKEVSLRELQQRALNAERDAQLLILRDVFNNACQHVVLDPACKTPTVVQLARSLYEERRFEDMPVLADALEEAGCTNAEVLNHCRSGGDHVRGCWALDLILEKS
jgi:hypothetical protein